MLTVGASSTRHVFVRASSPIMAPTRSTRPGSHVAPSAEPHGTQVDVGPPLPGSTGPRAPDGPSVTFTFGIPSRSTATVDHMSAPAVSSAFSSSVSARTSASTSRPVMGATGRSRSAACRRA